MKRPRLLSLRELRRVPRWCPDSEVRKHSPRPLSELRNRKDTSNIMILVPLLNPKFATVPAARSCELRVRGTRAGSLQIEAQIPSWPGIAVRRDVYARHKVYARAGRRPDPGAGHDGARDMR